MANCSDKALNMHKFPLPASKVEANYHYHNNHKLIVRKNSQIPRITTKRIKNEN